MKNAIPFNKDIQFDNNIYEISSISLEHAEKIEESIVGTLTVSGEYRTHELSVNKEQFKYDLPFNIELDDNIIRDSITVDIDDFTYEIKDNVLKVAIVMGVYGEKVEDESIADLIEEIDKRSMKEEVEEEVVEEPEVEEETDEQVEERTNECEAEEPDTETREELNEVILNNPDAKDEYITYKVHIVAENETLESICTLHKVTSSLVSDYNDTSNIQKGDKLIIPMENNE